MGDYSATCSVSGLPITYGQKVVGFNLEPYRWANESSSPRHLFIPASMPVIGEYDSSGGIDDENLECDCALIHLDIWENSKMYWHSGNRPFVERWLDIPSAIERAQREKETKTELNLSGYDKWTETDYLYHVLWNQFSNTDTGLVFRNMIDGANVSEAATEDRSCFLHRGAFMEAMLQKMLEGWTDEDWNTVNTLIRFWCGERITGRYIQPASNPRMEQFPEYKQRIKILQFTTKLAKKLQKDLNDK